MSSKQGILLGASLGALSVYFNNDGLAVISVLTMAVTVPLLQIKEEMQKKGE